MQVFTLKEWNEKRGIHARIKTSLESLHIAYLYGVSNLDLEYYSYNKYFGYKKKPEVWNESFADYILYLIGNRMKMEHFSDLLYELNKKIPTMQKNIIVLNGKKNPLFNQFPEGSTILHKYIDNQLAPKHRNYKKEKMHKTLKELFDEIPNLPYQPLEIYGYGSFFREKEQIGDVDLYFVHDDNNLRWQRFRTFFKKQGEKYLEFINLVIDEYNKEGRKSGRIISLKKKCKEEEFKKLLDKYNVNKDFLKNCTWKEIFANDTLGLFSPDIDKLFLRMFGKNKKGLQVQFSRKGLNDGKNYILLWSKERPSFEINYSQWKEQEKEQYIRKEYSHLVNDLDRWKSLLKDEIPLITASKKTKEFAFQEFNKLQAEFPLDTVNTEPYEELNQKTNILREKMKIILNEIKKLETKKRLDNIIGIKQYIDQEKNKSHTKIEKST